jgi:hypothetical protein
MGPYEIPPRHFLTATDFSIGRFAYPRGFASALQLIGAGFP